jgi:hypothetical protein
MRFFGLWPQNDDKYDMLALVKLGYMLETLSISHYSPKGSDNVMSADNQQERLKTVGWIVGFVDGEGCFSVTIQRCRVVKLGWQVFPEFVVTQGAKSVSVLHFLRDFFDCGRIFINNRTDNHREPIYRFCVRAVRDLREKIIPFFKENQLRTIKRHAFAVFAEVLQRMEHNEHLTEQGLRSIANLAGQINKQKKPRFLESSETVRQAPADEVG